MFCYLWEFRVRPGRLRDFEVAYGPHGAWVQLFRRDAAYVRTDLLRNVTDPTRFITMDYWKTRDACMDFRERFQPEFHTIDASCAAFTADERHIGNFELIEE